MIKDQTRRSFLSRAPLAAAILSLPLSEKVLYAAAAQTPAPEPFQLFTADKLSNAAKELHAKPGNDNLFQPPTVPLTIVMTTEGKKVATEFEFHEGRDHVLQVIEGSTVYEVGGTPRNQRSTKPGEWLAPISEGAFKFTLHKGDMLVIPRNTPHKRSTEDSVTFTLISSTGSLKT
jgi:mannose-6-phosphate isomerase-like protein (cupin superfamily)